MKQYHDMLNHILLNGKTRKDRTGVGTIGVFGYQLKHDLSEGFPLLTTKKVHTKSMIHELLWFLRGETNVRSLQQAGVTIWDEWADPNGELGPVYGRQWRAWEDPANNRTIDQVANVVQSLTQDPWSRRHIVIAWNPAVLHSMALPPCHMMFQFHVDPDENGNPYKLNCQLYQRSCDAFLGVPFNIASYSLLTMMMAQVVGLKPGVFTHTFGDLHIYLNHMEQVKLQLSREPRPLPQMVLNPYIKHIDAFKYEDFTLEGYDPWPGIKAEIAI